ncbi:MAG: TlpA disulfide reductase family protein [Mycobacteriales bacterium]
MRATRGLRRRTDARAIVLFAICLLLTGCARRSSAAAPASGVVAEIGRRRAAPRLAGESLTGAPLDVADFRGRVVAVNIWGSWCGPCQAEARDLVRVAAATQPLGVQFVGIDIRDNRAAAISFEKDYGIDYPSLFDGGMQIVAGFKSFVYPPTTYVIDRKGRISATLFGAIDPAVLERLLRTVAAEPG